MPTDAELARAMRALLKHDDPTIREAAEDAVAAELPDAPYGNTPWSIGHMQRVILREFAWAREFLKRTRPPVSDAACSIPEDEGIVMHWAYGISAVIEGLAKDKRADGQVRSVDPDVVRRAVRAIARGPGRPSKGDDGDLGEALLAVLKAAGLASGGGAAVLKKLQRDIKFSDHDIEWLEDLFKPTR